MLNRVARGERSICLYVKYYYRDFKYLDDGTVQLLHFLFGDQVDVNREGNGKLL